MLITLVRQGFQDIPKNMHEEHEAQFEGSNKIWKRLPYNLHTCTLGIFEGNGLQPPENGGGSLIEGS